MSPLIVAFDTATDAIGLGIGALDGERLDVLSGGYEHAPRNSNTRLLSLLSERLEQAGAKPSDIGAIVCGRGPGSFTGVRIGVATAKGLAQGLGVPLVGVGTLDAIAWGRPDGGRPVIAVVGDAMRSEVYPAVFDVRDGVPVRRAADSVAKPADVAQLWSRELAAADVVLAGNGLKKYADLFTQALPAAKLAAEEAWWPSGEGLLAAFMAAGGPRLFDDGDPALLLPVYTRLSDAEENEQRRQQAASGLRSNGVAGPAAGSEDPR